MSETIEAQADPVMIRNSYGDLVNRRFVRPERLLEDELVRDLAAAAEALHQQIVDFKARAFDQVSSLMALLAQQHGAKATGRAGGVTLTSFDGMLQITVSSANTMTFGPEIQTAKALIDECLTDWLAGASDEIKQIINSAFDVGENGRLRVDRILALRDLNFPGRPKWGDARNAINMALRVDRRREYIRFHRRANRDAEWAQIVLDASRV